MEFGFSFNNHSSKPEMAIQFSEAIHPAAGPAASIHLFYDLAQAKVMLNQLQKAIAQAEGTNEV